jgi:hypothetical protein
MDSNWVVASATVIYALLTVKLWRETKKSADAATKSAEAAKQSVEVIAALHRPIIGFEGRPIPNRTGIIVWTIPVALRNYGTLPPTHLNASFEFYTESPQESRFPLQTIDGPESAEIPPDSAYEADLSPALSDETQRKVNSRVQNLILTLKATYSAPDGRKFEYAGEARFDTVSRRFVVQRSETRTI